MRHAGPASLAGLTDVLERIRVLPGLTERSPGVFHRRSRAFLHFHEDPTGLFADVRPGPDDGFVRLRVSDPAERDHLVAVVIRALDAAPGPRPRS